MLSEQEHNFSALLVLLQQVSGLAVVLVGVGDAGCQVERQQARKRYVRVEEPSTCAGGIFSAGNRDDEVGGVGRASVGDALLDDGVGWISPSLDSACNVDGVGGGVDVSPGRVLEGVWKMGEELINNVSEAGRGEDAGTQEGVAREGVEEVFGARDVGDRVVHVGEILDEFV